eukprot:TRINITY_DN8357_c0_g1_i7.p1 TRINITY_DN8357_c0_g1~~TRINITY_DN8357_c0_g1_i7.p1  ORF type:complete len:332 (+),score=30.39 TRINITY_DN8357_c0_g1_i7:113-1108(+)
MSASKATADEIVIQDLIQQAKGLCEQHKFQDAIRDLCNAMNTVSFEDTDRICEILLMRGTTYCKLCCFYLSYPAELSEKGGVLFGYEPSWLAHMASLDATRLLKLQPNNISTYHLAGDSSFLCERYKEAKLHYLKGLSINPEDKYILQQMIKIQNEFSQQQDRRTSFSSSVLLDNNDADVECSVCYRVLYEPVSTPCGHSFCRTCLARSLGHTSKCPMCRTVLHMGQELPITIVLHNLIKRVLPAQFEARRKEEEGQTLQTGGILPVFVMDILFPGETIALNIFEPRYRLMIRRCLEGNQKFAMAISRAGTLGDLVFITIFSIVFIIQFLV